MDKAKAKDILSKMIEATPEALKKQKLMFVVSADIYFAIGRKSYRGYKIINGSLYDMPKNYGILANACDIGAAMKSWNVFKQLKEKFPNESNEFLASII